MRVLWTLTAEQDRADIVDYIAKNNPLAAIRMDELFEIAIGAAVGGVLPASPQQPAASLVSSMGAFPSRQLHATTNPASQAHRRAFSLPAARVCAGFCGVIRCPARA
jgi:hypothetical protein